MQFRRSQPERSRYPVDARGAGGLESPALDSQASYFRDIFPI